MAALIEPGLPGVYSKKWVGAWKVPWLAANRTLPFGKIVAGASANVQNWSGGVWPPHTWGRLGPADHVLVAVLNSAVCATLAVLAPNAMTEPSSPELWRRSSGKARPIQ